MQEPASWRSERGGRRDRRGTSVCGWVLAEPLRPGRVCESWVGVREERRAVVRILRPPFAQDAFASAAWRSAGWAPNRFHHARVPRMLEEGTDEHGAPALVRRWATGQSLDDAARERPLETGAALRLTEQLLDALELAHAHGIVHGAIAPSNVVVTPRGSMRLVDFAAPRPLRAARAPGEEALEAARIGAFTPPERRARTSAAPTGWNEAADVWSVGACLYWALSGRIADGALLAQGVPRDVLAVIELAMARDPADRYESAYAMLGDVRRLQAGQRPRLETVLAPVPSQTYAPRPVRIETTEPLSSSQTAGLESLPAPAPPRSRREKIGNFILLLAIAVLVGAATFVVVRERQGEVPAEVRVR
jgi:serine/threonine-protein kinase